MVVNDTLKAVINAKTPVSDRGFLCSKRVKEHDYFCARRIVRDEGRNTRLF